MYHNDQEPPGIVITCYNRPKALIRILKSVENADYPTDKNIPLIISIDGGGPPSVVEIANEFIWPHGEKKVIHNKYNLGLKNHILSCGDLTKNLGSIILLEDDLIVSKSFYFFAYKAEAFYIDDPDVAQISLYAYTMSEHSLSQFNPLKRQGDVYFMKWPSSWGQLWTRSQWIKFRSWLKKNSTWEHLKDFVPSNVAKWPDTSWKKYFAAYLCLSKKYVVYPYFSFTCLYGDAGENHKSGMLPQFKTALALDFQQFEFVLKDESKLFYDEYFQPTKVLVDSLTKKFLKYDYEVDFEGIKKLKNINTKYLISIKSCTSPIESFGWELSPVELNIGSNIGNKIHFGMTRSFNERLSLFTWSQTSYRLNQLLSVYQESKRIVLKIILKLTSKV